MGPGESEAWGPREALSLGSLGSLVPGAGVRSWGAGDIGSPEAVCGAGAWIRRC